jgi:hypothetical protein
MALTSVGSFSHAGQFPLRLRREPSNSTKRPYAVFLFPITCVFIFACSPASVGQSCLYGLGTYSSSSDACRALQKEALQRVASANTICYSANSQVQWSKNNKEPEGAFSVMSAGARIAMKGFTTLYSCERADLVVKIDYNAFFSASVTLAVTDAESGSLVFKEERSVSDL